MKKVVVRMGSFWVFKGGVKYSIASSKPQGFDELRTLGWATPPWELTKSWRDGVISWAEFEEQYLQLLRSRWPVIKEWLFRVEREGQDVQLCSWHRPPKHDHRHTLWRALEASIRKLKLNIIVIDDDVPSPAEYFKGRRQPEDRDARSGLDDAGEPKELIGMQREADANAYLTESWEREAAYLQGEDPADVLDLSRVPFVKPGMHGRAEEFQMREDVLRYVVNNGRGNRWWSSPQERRLQAEALAAFDNDFGVEFDTEALRLFE